MLRVLIPGLDALDGKFLPDETPHGLVASLEARARPPTMLPSWAFIANDSYDPLEFRQALVFEGEGASSQLQPFPAWRGQRKTAPI